ncbi:MAG: class II glutamine amidotransferase [Hamadaea sp.]|nr:class II glutamine amidotransferase [Hamadaea sp.]
MCRWLAYWGSPVYLDDLLYRPAHSLIDQSLHAKLGVETTNGDGFGVGWYAGKEPGVFHGIGPAWNNRNLRNLAAHIQAPIVLAHIRASTGTPVQETNCHPFRYQNWLWMHNGSIAEFRKVKRDLLLAVSPDLFPFIEGSTDSELMFYLALTFGLQDDPPNAVARMVGFVEKTGREHGVEHPMQMTVATSDGERMWAYRYSSGGTSRSLFYSSDVGSLRQLHPDVEILRLVSDDSRLIVSEPLGDLPGAWNKVPESTYGVVQEGLDVMRHFEPVWP